MSAAKLEALRKKRRAAQARSRRAEQRLAEIAKKGGMAVQQVTVEFVHDEPLPLADQLLREKLVALKSAEQQLSAAYRAHDDKMRAVDAARAAVVTAENDAHKASDAVTQAGVEFRAATAEVGKRLAERDDIFEFDGQFYVKTPGQNHFTAYSKPVVLS